VIWSSLQNCLGLILILIFLSLPNPKYVFVSLALWIFTSTIITSFLLKTSFTVANIITLCRAFGLVICSLILAYNESITNLLIVLLSICLLADALDGYIARLYTSSSAGKVLDGETDQQFVLLVASASYILLNLPFWLLFFPGIKYVFEISYNLFNLKVKENKGKKRRKIIAAAVMSILLINLTSLISKEIMVLLSTIGFIALSYSFFDDLINSVKTK